MIWIALALVVGFVGGWFSCRKFGTVADKVNTDLGNPIK